MCRVKLKIQTLVVGDDTFCGQRTIVRASTDYFKKKARPQEGRIDFDWHAHRHHNLLSPWPTDLDAEFSKEEIKRAVFDSNADGAPGLDGFPMSFYQTFWEVIKVDLSAFAKAFHEQSARLIHVNKVWIFLLPKIPGASNITELRPISLANCSYKILSKLLANRLKAHIDSIISPTQSAFIAGRAIQDSVAIVTETACFLREENREGLMIKLDFEKAFDTLDWEFLLGALQAKGFSGKWLSWISTLLETSRYSVLVNGEEGGFFRSWRGVKQGCPLSPFLFIVAVDFINSLLRNMIDSGALTPLGDNNRWEASITQFADDTLIFCRADRAQVLALKIALFYFELSSGLAVNLHKSSLFYIGADTAQGPSLAAVLDCKLGQFRSTYLGIPIADRTLPKSAWNSLIEELLSVLRRSTHIGQLSYYDDT